MDLSTYLKAERGRAAKLSRDIGVASAWVWQMAAGVRPIPPIKAVDIERATAGMVKRQEMRPLDWHRIWPELQPAGQPQASQEQRAAA
jgi:DNA-binding transcriptional regulator YdaS (Cro superfamily)